jgi:anti-sigma regulatory factor (Ser/Thr protein kinase)
MDSEPLPQPPHDAQRVAYLAADDLAEVRGLVRRQARTAGLDEDKTAALLIAVNELASNSIEHAGGGGSLCVWVGGGALVCQIEDHGQIEEATDRRMPTDPGSGSRGYGLPLVVHLTDRAVCVSGPAGTRWQLRMNLNGSRPATSAHHTVTLSKSVVDRGLREPRQ